VALNASQYIVALLAMSYPADQQ